MRPDEGPLSQANLKKASKSQRSEVRQGTPFVIITIGVSLQNPVALFCKTEGKLFQSVHIKLRPFSQMAILNWDARQVLFGGLAGFFYLQKAFNTLRSLVL